MFKFLPSVSRQTLSALSGAIIVQVIVLVIAIFVGVMEPFEREKAVFHSNKPSSEKQLNYREMQGALASLERSASPDVDFAQQMLNFESLQEISHETLDRSSLSSVADMLLSESSFFESELMGFTGSTGTEALSIMEPVEFLGSEFNSERIVILVDISSSVKAKVEKAGLSMQRLKDEVGQFIEKLSPNHLIGLVQFSRKLDTYNDALVPATKAAKRKIHHWLDTRLRTNGTSGSGWRSNPIDGIQSVMETAFAMDGQLSEIILITDGDFQYTLPSGGGKDVSLSGLRNHTKLLQEDQLGQTRLSLILFYPQKEHLTHLKSWARENGEGEVRIYSE